MLQQIFLIYLNHLTYNYFNFIIFTYNPFVFMINNRWSKVFRSDNLYLPTLNYTPIINKNSKLCLMGSCFADEIGWQLHSRGLDIGKVTFNNELKQALYPWGTFFNTSNLFEILSHCISDRQINFDMNHFIKVPLTMIGNHYESETSLNHEVNFKLMNLFFKARLDTSCLDTAIDEINMKLNFFKDSILNADTYIITLGLIEVWVDKLSKLTWHAFHGKALNKKSIDDKAEFKRLSYEENTKNISKIINLLLNTGPQKKIIFTVSPIPLAFTFTNSDIVVANRYSKSVLRASIENFIDNKKIFYFPSFEIVTDCVGWPEAFDDSDKRHIKVSVFNDYIAPLFMKKFTDTI